EYRQLSRVRADEWHTDAGAFRSARSGGEQDAADADRTHLRQGDLVVAAYHALHLELAEVLHEVEDERGVVVDDEHTHGGHLVAVGAGLLEMVEYGITSSGGRLAGPLDGLCTESVPGPPLPVSPSPVTCPSVNGMYCSMLGNTWYHSNPARAPTISSEPMIRPARPNGR